MEEYSDELCSDNVLYSTCDPKNKLLASTLKLHKHEHDTILISSSLHRDAR